MQKTKIAESLVAVTHTHTYIYTKLTKIHDKTKINEILNLIDINKTRLNL